jgi:hypothetical protein
VQVTRLEILHEVASLLSACLADSPGDEVGDNIVRLQGDGESAVVTVEKSRNDSPARRQREAG